MKAVFDTKPNSRYDDAIVERYHFPAQSNYLAAANGAIGDWIIYREPRRDGGRQAYIAMARVKAVVPDPDNPRYAYAQVEEFLPFDRPVPFAGAPVGAYWEGRLRAVQDPARVGAALQNRSLRMIEDSDFAAIVLEGLRDTLNPANAVRLGLAEYQPGLADQGGAVFNYDTPPGVDQVRRVEQILLNRKIRDANFRRQVCDAYDNTCAVTGLRIVNGGGRAEAQAAHIWSVADGGPDVVQNGLALSGTVHWLFDRYLISLTNDYELLVSHNKVPVELRALFERQMKRIVLPRNEALWPHPAYIERHRERYMAA